LAYYLKWKKITLIIVSLLFLFAISVIDYSRDEHIYFSEKPGFYENPVDLKIIGGAGCQIYYTLDGSEPTKESNLYSKTESIYLSDASDNPNYYSARTDTSASFYTELIEKYSDMNPQYTVPDYNVDKCNIIRASAFDREGNLLDSIEGVYFISFQNKNGYKGGYIASLVTEPENLFDYETGIYNTGITFESFVRETLGAEENWTTPYWWWWDCNYSRRGMESEREASVTIFNQNRECVLKESCGIRIRGGGSRGRLPKSIGCYARKKYSGSNEFSADLFGRNAYAHKFIFFSGGDDSVFKLMDYLANTLEQELNFSTMKFIPCAMFLNGEYWGEYYITESYNADYISDHYHVDKEEVIMIKNGEITEGTEGDLNLFFEAWYFISENDMTILENYEQACNFIDLDSYIDYYAAQVYIARCNDWPGGNEAVWRTRENNGSRFGDGKWRWMLFDVNSGGMTIDLADADTLAALLQRDSVFYSLYQNEEFREKFVKRLLYIGRTVFSEERYENFLNMYSSTMREAVEASNLRFYNFARTEEFDKNVENTREFFRRRYHAVWNSLAANIGGEWLSEHGIQKFP